MAGRRDVVPVVVVIALLALGLLAAAFGNPSIEALPGQVVPTTGAATPQAPIEDSAVATVPPEDVASVAPSRAPVSALVVLAAALALIAAAVLAWWLRRHRTSAIQLTEMVPRPVVPGQERRLVWGAVDQGLDALAESDADPRRAVIACWSRLEAVAAGAGTARRPGDTSTDLVVRLLDAHRVSADVVADFGAVYRRARFAAHEVNDAMRAQAQAALRQLRDEMAAVAGRS